MPSPDHAALRERVNAGQWYHTLELAPGLLTPGWFDLRGIVDRVLLPARLDGLRCLDVGTFDGFWAFEMERRGAAEVVAVDLLDPLRWDWPAGSEDQAVTEVGRRKGRGEGFEIAREALGSGVRRQEISVYDLDPAAIGEFDVVYVGSLLLHLRDPIRAIERVRTVCRGEAIFVDAVSLSLSTLRRPVAALDGRGRPWWWKPNVAGLRRMVEVGGFRLTAGPVRVFLPAGGGQQLPKVTPRLLGRPGGLRMAVEAWKGDPHAALRARPLLGL